MNTKRSFLFWILGLLLNVSAFAQSAGEIKGRIVNEDKDGIPGVIVSLRSGSALLAKQLTDLDGNFTFSNLHAGIYDVDAKASLYPEHLEKNIEVSTGKVSYVNIRLRQTGVSKDTLFIYGHRESPLDKYFSPGIDLKSEQLQHSASDRGNGIAIITGFLSDVQPTPDGKDLYIRGTRAGTTEYFVDGEKVIGSFSVPSLSMGGITVYTGGVPAQFGDVSGGVVLITTMDYVQGMKEKEERYLRVFGSGDENSEEPK